MHDKPSGILIVSGIVENIQYILHSNDIVSETQPRWISVWMDFEWKFKIFLICGDTLLGTIINPEISIHIKGLGKNTKVKMEPYGSSQDKSQLLWSPPL